ncbi:hypothetical protein Tco_0129926, partial [Tanacetum coccineum]
TETPESPLTIALPILLLEGTPPTLVPILCRTTRMAVRVLPAMSSGLSASMAEVAAMSDSAFRKRFRSSYESSPFVSPPDLPLWNHYRGTSKLVEDSEEDEEIEESMDSDSVSEDAEDQDPTIEGIRILLRRTRVLLRVSRAPVCMMRDMVRMMRVMATPFVGTAVSAPLGLRYGALRHRELALEEDDVYSMFEVGQGSRSAESALEFGRPERVSAFRQPTLTIWTDPEDGMIYIDILDYPPPAPHVQTPPSPEWTSGSLSISL